MAFRIRQGQHSHRTPDVGFDFWFLNVNVKVFGNSGICLCTSKWDSGICTWQFKHHYGGCIKILCYYGIIYGFKLYDYMI